MRLFRAKLILKTDLPLGATRLKEVTFPFLVPDILPLFGKCKPEEVTEYGIQTCTSGESPDGLDLTDVLTPEGLSDHHAGVEEQVCALFHLRLKLKFRANLPVEEELGGVRTLLERTLSGDCVGNRVRPKDTLNQAGL